MDYSGQYLQAGNMQQQFEQLVQQNQQLVQQNQQLAQQNQQLAQQHHLLVQQNHLLGQRVQIVTDGHSNTKQTLNDLIQEQNSLLKEIKEVKKSEESYRARLVKSAEKLNENVKDTVSRFLKNKVIHDTTYCILKQTCMGLME